MLSSFRWLMMVGVCIRALSAQAADTVLTQDLARSVIRVDDAIALGAENSPFVIETRVTGAGGYWTYQYSINHLFQNGRMTTGYDRPGKGEPYLVPSEFNLFRTLGENCRIETENFIFNKPDRIDLEKHKIRLKRNDLLLVATVLAPEIDRTLYEVALEVIGPAERVFWIRCLRQKPVTVEFVMGQIGNGTGKWGTWLK